MTTTRNEKQNLQEPEFPGSRTKRSSREGRVEKGGYRANRQKMSLRKLEVILQETSSWDGRYSGSVG